MKVLPLEGPHKHHDAHGKDASYPAKGKPTPTGHWEKHYSLSRPSENMYATEGADFSPKRSDDRKTTYKKVNREDH